MVDAGGTSDGATPCTNVDTASINIDPSGWVCQNQWGIQGKWYCSADPAGVSSCVGSTVPFRQSPAAMCLQGTTATSGAMLGGLIGLGLNQASPASSKLAYNAKQQRVVGFAITLTGDSGGSVLDIAFPPSLGAGGAAPVVTVPGVSGSTITYNVILVDASLPNNTASPAKALDPTDITDIQIGIPTDSVAHTYDYCVTSVVPLEVIPPPPSGSGPYGPGFNEGNSVVLEELGAYALLTNSYSPAQPENLQLEYTTQFAAYIASPTFANSTTVQAAPMLAYGWIPGGYFVGASGGGYAGGKTIGTLTSVMSGLDWSPAAPSGGPAFTVGWDCWFAPTPAPVTAGREMMIWIGQSGNQAPIGALSASSPTINGQTWAVYTGTNAASQPIVTYVVSGTTISGVSWDLLPFFQDAATNARAGFSSSDYLLGVHAGFRLFGAGTWQATFSAAAK